MNYIHLIYSHYVINFYEFSLKNHQFSYFLYCRDNCDNSCDNHCLQNSISSRQCRNKPKYKCHILESNWSNVFRRREGGGGQLKSWIDDKNHFILLLHHGQKYYYEIEKLTRMRVGGFRYRTSRNFAHFSSF